MDPHQQTLRAGTCAIVCALLLRLGAGGFFDPLAEFLAKPNITSFLIYLETGRIVRFSYSPQEQAVFAMESPPPDFALEATIPEELPEFSPEDGENVLLRNNSSLKPEPEKLICQPLDWDLTVEAPTVLILHTHATESYTKSEGEKYQESSAYRTLDQDYNMVGVGDYLTALLEAAGITAIHDRELHDYPSYNGSYNHARKAIAAYLKEYPTIRLVLDLHRDASGDNKNQLRPLATVEGEKAAQLMIVVGTSGSGLEHPQWKENLSLGLKLHVQLERIAPGICRYVNLRSQRFNQDMSPGALLVEVGGAGNTHGEARKATEILAKGIIALSKGSG